MKRISILLIVISLLLPQSVVNIHASEPLKLVENVISDTALVLDSDVAPEPYFPFVYIEGKNYKWLGDVLAYKVTTLDPGFLYVANQDTNEITKVVEQQVLSYANNGEYIFAATCNQEIIRVDYRGLGAVSIYKSTSGTLAALEYEDRMLYFMDGDLVVRMDTRSLSCEVLLEQANVASIYPYKAGYLLLDDMSGQQFNYSIKEGTLTLVSDENQLNELLNSTVTWLDPTEPELMMLTPEADASIQAVTDTYIGLPMNDFPTGSYFTTTNSACDNHDSCRRYARTNQCDGFARYVNEHYYHVSGDEETAPYSVYGDRVSPYDKYEEFVSETRLYNFFNKLETGAYVRVSKRSEAEDSVDPYKGQGSHSFVYVSHDRNGAVLYEANLDDKCGVSYSYRDYDELLRRYPYFFGWVNHDQEGAVINSSTSYHRIKCSHSSCNAYVVEPHSYVAEGMSYRCTVCGDLTDIPTVPVLPG